MKRDAAAPRKIAVCSTPETVARACADKFVEAGSDAIALRGKFCVALSGGHTPAALYHLLGQPPQRDLLDWSRVHLFWSDERAVAADHPASNFAMAQRELISHIPLPPANVHRMEGERASLEDAAGSYEKVLRSAAPANPQGIPRLDLVLLGLGADGHTASLFPGEDALDEKRRLVVGTAVAVAGFRRLTMSLILLNAARRIWFVVTGREKSAILKSVIQETRIRFPAQRVRPRDGELIFWADRAAAEGLGAGKTQTS